VYIPDDVNLNTLPTPRTVQLDKALAESCQALARAQGIERGVGGLILFLMERGDVHYNRACAFARKGRRTAALRSLRRAVEFGWFDGYSMRDEDDLKSLRCLPSFWNILSDLGLKKAPRRATIRSRVHGTAVRR
jgi:hypothetical protein